MPDGESWATGCSRLGGVVLVKKRHVEVDAVVPDARRLQRDGGDESQCAGSVGECANGPCSPLDLPVEAFEAVGRADAHPVLLGERVVRSRVGEAALEARDGFWEFRPEPRGEAAQASLRGLERL